ncbi:MAG: YtxH domain-containing protein [Chitinophagaceae bacterium]
MKKENQKLLAGLVIGAAAGSALTIFLQGESGKKLLSTIKDTAKSTGEEVKDGISYAQSGLESLLKKGRKFLEDLRGDKRLTIDEELEEIYS